MVVPALRYTWAAAILLLTCALDAPRAGADPFPEKPVKIVIPYPISGPTDIRGTTRITKTYKLIALNAPPAISDTLARLAGQAIGAASRHSVVLERQPGGVTTRGAKAVARARPDGYTLLLASNATMVINPHYFQGVEYEPVRDFVLVAPLAAMPFVLLAGSGVPVDTASRLVQWLKVRPGEVNYGSSGDGSVGHLAGELFRRATGVNIVHVSYNGGIAALSGLATEQISLVFAALPLALPYVPAGQFRALGITSRQRFALLPALPTLVETGLPELEVEAWFGLFGPARMPPSAAAWLNEQVAAQIADNGTRMQLLALGLDPAAGTRSQFATRIHSETERWAPVLRASRMPLKEGRDG
jgi:tripartite-type tricarboxylate transporter receptor subunit TctC